MTETLTAQPIAAPRWRHFLRHAAEMVAAMLVGMALLDPIWGAVLDLAGRPDLVALISATDMTAAMTVWMLYWGHGRARVVEMAAAMYVPFLALIVPFWLGLLPGEHIAMGGHVLMLPAMAAAMLVHRDEYSGPHGSAHTAHPVITVLAERWPTWVALAMTAETWRQASVPPPWILLVLPSAYLVLGGIRGRLRDPRMLAVQLAGFALYLGLAVVAATVEPELAVWVVAGAWGAHSLWDLAHHRADAVVPRGYSEWCFVVDLVIAVTIVLSW